MITWKIIVLGVFGGFFLIVTIPIFLIGYWLGKRRGSKVKRYEIVSHDPEIEEVE